jgi:dual specificity phosphatase 12
MRTLSLPFADALCVVRESRPVVSPNIGFTRQLKLWEECKYDVLVDHDTEEKVAYRIWKEERDGLLKKGEEAIGRARVSAMGSMAAYFGQMRLEKVDKGEDKEQTMKVLSKMQTK